MKKKFKRFIVVFLVLAMILPIQELQVFAETVSENEVMEEDGNNGQVTNPIGPKTVSGEDMGEETFPETDAIGKEFSHAGVNEERIPTAPVHHCALDYTDFSYVYFGSYPQSEVTDSTIIAAIENAISASGPEPNADVGVDVLVDGIKYRRISRSDTNYDGNLFGDSDYRYFKWEKIKWKVLQNDGNTLFVVADKALDCKNYHNKDEEITWESSDIRSWLNDSFYDTAFNSGEQGAIVEQTIVNKDNPDHGTKGGNDTRDKVYLLSLDEVTKEIYGFCSDGSIDSQSRKITASDYSRARGTSEYSEYHSGCWWWLRSPGWYSGDAAYVSSDGCALRYYGYTFTTSYDDDYGGVCPALHINLQSDFWSVQEDRGVTEHTIQTEEEIPVNPIHHCEIADYTDWDYIYFGSYPQSEVTDEATIQAIDSAISQGLGQVAGTVEGNEETDVWVNEIKYRRIRKDNINDDGNFDEVLNSSCRYFQWERIKWRVLQNDGNTLFVAADKAIDHKGLENERESVIWEASPIRNWLNNSFYNAAFSSGEQGAIVIQNVVNEDNPYFGTEGGNDTRDNVYLLSISEVTNAAYGFCGNYSIYSMSRKMKTSDYANARREEGGSLGGYCQWALRSPGFFAAAYVTSNGSIRPSSSGEAGYCGNICPTLHINLSSDLWTMADDSGNYGKKILKKLQASKKKTEYMQGENLNLDDLTVTAVYENSSKILPADTYTINAAAIDMNTPGNKTLTISYTEGTITKTAAITITVTPKVDTAQQAKKGTKITDKASAGTYKVTSADSEAPTVEYTAPTSTKKKTITIPQYVTYQGVKYKVTSVSAKSFKGNKKLTTIKIASTITKIGDSAFEGCISLKTVTIGTGLKTIGKNAFKNCKKLKTLTIKSSKLKTVGKNAFKGINPNCKIKVPAKKVKAYTKLMKKKGQKSTVKITK